MNLSGSNPKVICYIQAFDCEETIEAAMESIRNQTYNNWLCFVLSNGNIEYNGNHSFDIIKSIAKKDSRFIVLNKQHNFLQMYVPMLYYLSECFKNSYICSLDSDDVYSPDFFERAVQFAVSENLDIVACGTQIVLKQEPTSMNETILSERLLEKNLIIRGNSFNSLFPVYKKFLNEMWGKLYSTDLLSSHYSKKINKKILKDRFVPDTLFVVEKLFNSKGIGILSGTSHKFYQFVKRNKNNGTALTNLVHKNHDIFRLEDINFLKIRRFSVYFSYYYIINFLKSYGDIDPYLYDYMQAVLFGWFEDYYDRTLLMTTNPKALTQYMIQLILNPKFDELMQYKDLGKFNNLICWNQRLDFCIKLKYFLMGQKNIRNRDNFMKKNLHCSRRTKKQLDRMCEKLDINIQSILQLRG